MSIKRKMALGYTYSGKPANKVAGICEANISAFKASIFAMEVIFTL